MAARLTGPISGKLAAAIAAADVRDGREAINQVRAERDEIEAAGAPRQVAADAVERDQWRDQVRAEGRGRLVCQFDLFGEAVAWARTGRNRAQGKTFTPRRQREHMGLVARQAALAMGCRPPLPAGVAVALTVMVWMPIPKSWPKWRRADAAAGKVRPTVKPDADNFAKLVKDSLGPPKVRNRPVGPGVVWDDDAQVVDLFVRKFYTAGEPCTQVQVRAA